MLHITILFVFAPQTMFHLIQKVLTLELLEPSQSVHLKMKAEFMFIILCMFVYVRIHYLWRTELSLRSWPAKTFYLGLFFYRVSHWDLGLSS